MILLYRLENDLDRRIQILENIVHINLVIAFHNGQRLVKLTRAMKVEYHC